MSFLIASLAQIRAWPITSSKRRRGIWRRVFALAALTPDRRRPGSFWDREDVAYYVSAGLISRRLADAAGRRRFQREAQMASSLNHPHILTVHDVGEFEGHDYLITEFVGGGTLKDWAKAEKRSWKQVLELLVGVADGLAAAHDAGILHRDIKPANILVATPLTERAFDGEKAGIPLVRLNRSPSVQICTVSGTTSTAYSRLHVPVGFLFSGFQLLS